MRWFQYGAFCPLFRLHGGGIVRSNSRRPPTQRGGPNEVWSFGDRAYGIIREYCFCASVSAVHHGTNATRRRQRHSAHAPAVLRFSQRSRLR